MATRFKTAAAMKSIKKLFLYLMLCSLSAYILAAKVATQDDVRELSGISIIGNKEAPKSLYIVPWKNSQVGIATSLSSGLLNKSMTPIDKDVFLRELEYYELSHPK